MISSAGSNGTFVAALHTHSNFSLLAGVPSPTALAEAAARAGYSALALTDHASFAGAVEFADACAAAGIKPLYGMEIELAAAGEAAYPLILLAETHEGWSNLCRLSSRIKLSEAEGGAAFCSPADLTQHAGGLLCLTGGTRGELYRLISSNQQDEARRRLETLKAIFPNRLYVQLEIHTPRDKQAALALQDAAHRLIVPTVASHDVYYLQPQQADLQRTLAAIRLNTTLQQLPGKALAPAGAWLLSPEELRQQFADFPGALERTGEIADRCQFELELGVMHFPRLNLPAGMSAMDLLRHKAEAGAARKYKSVTPEIRERLNYELGVISRMGYETIFLIVEELLTFARVKDILTASRGSAASSLVAYCLDITTPDPLANNLYFERFLNEARAKPPDIDTDICSRRREEVIAHMFAHYGAEHVAMVSTINRFRPRSAFSDAAKAHGMQPAEIKALTRKLPYGFRQWLEDRAGEDEEDEHKPPPSAFRGIASQFSDLRQRKIIEQAEMLLGLPRHLSQHAGGMVVTPCPITDLVPIMPTGTKGVNITAMNLDAVERLGLVKIDLLGIRGLTVLSDVAGAIQSWRKLEYPSMLSVLECIPLEDAATAETVSQGKTIGCFQIESPGMRATLRAIKAGSVEDLTRALSLYRPGPLKGGFRDVFIRRQTGVESTTYLHPTLEPILRESNGIVLYQEQVLRIANAIGGLSLTESELLRRAMTHFDPGKQMQTLREKFLAGARELHAVPLETAEKLWELMAAFAGYGFPKAHAASYALAAWRSAWCKTHFPAEFLAAVMANWGGYYGQRVYLAEARRLGLKVHPPHVNHSRYEFSVSYPRDGAELYMGLNQVSGLTQRTISQIVRQRPFQSYDHFLLQVQPRPAELVSLVSCGGFSGMGSIPALLNRAGDTQPAAGQLSLFDHEPAEAAREEWDLRQRLEAQQRILGISVEAHPIEIYSERLAGMDITTSSEAITQLEKRLRVAGMCQSLRRRPAANGRMMAFMVLEDLEGVINVTLYPPAYERYRDLLENGRLYVMEGVMAAYENRDEPVLNAERVMLLDQA